MIDLINILKRYKGNNRDIEIFKDLSLKIAPGKLIVIKGASGGGKTTLLNILTLNDLDFSGQYLFNGQNIKHLTTKQLSRIKGSISYLTQGQSLFQKMSVLNNLDLVSNQDINIMYYMLQKFRLFFHIGKSVNKLSGGERQRLGILRALATNCKLLVLDEPTSNLDPLNRAVFYEEISKYKKNRMLIIATHDLELIAKADQVLDIKTKEMKTNKRITNNDKFDLTSSKPKIIKLVFLEIIRLKDNLLFVSTLSTALVGILLGLVITVGFRQFFVETLNNQIAVDSYVITPQDNSYLKYEDIIRFDNYFICNQDYGLICDANLAETYINLNINNNKVLVKILDSKDYAISSGLYRLLQEKNTIEFNGVQLLNIDSIKIYNSQDKIIYFPYQEISKIIVGDKNKDVTAQLLIVKQHFIYPFLFDAYKITHPYTEFFEPFKEIDDAIKIGIYGYGLISLFLGLITLAVITLLEIDSKKQKIGSLLLLGWSKASIYYWMITLNIIRVFISFFIQLIMLRISIDSINNIFKDLANYDNLFKIPDILVLTIFIIIIQIIVGNITFFTTMSLLKVTPKKLLSNY